MDGSARRPEAIILSMGAVILDAGAMKRTLGRMAHEILEANGGSQDLVVVGVLRRGYPVAKRLAFTMTQIEGATIPCGKLDVSASRDDRSPESGAGGRGSGEPGTFGLDRAAEETEDASEIPFEVTGKNVILVDEVVFTGRTVRAALDSLLKYGRPSRVQLAVLVDRGHRELPIQPDYVGKVVETSRGDNIVVKVFENEGEDAVLLEPESERGVVLR